MTNLVLQVTSEISKFLRAPVCSYSNMDDDPVDTAMSPAIPSHSGSLQRTVAGGTTFKKRSIISSTRASKKAVNRFYRRRGYRRRSWRSYRPNRYRRMMYRRRRFSRWRRY